MISAVDNDIVLKGACYTLLDRIIEAIPAARTEVGILGAAPFVITRQLKKKALLGDKSLILKSLEDFFREATRLEPQEEEQRLAAEFEFAAQRKHLSLDSGESQLCAMVVVRNMDVLATGDKRAVLSIAQLMIDDDRLNALMGRVRCLEQIVLSIIQNEEPFFVRSCICSEPSVDRALNSCFACHSQKICRDDIEQGLNSYISHLRSGSSELLAN